MTLTPPGEIFLREAKAVLERFEGAVALTREMAKWDGIRIRIGHSAASSIEALPRILSGFQKLHPEAKVELRTLTTLEMISSLRRGELDICLTVCGASADLEDFTVQEIDTYGLLVGLPRLHHLSELDQVPLKEVATESVISVTRSAFRWYNDYISGLLTVYNVSFRVAEEHDRAEGVIAAVEAGRGVALFYDVLARTIGERLALRQLTPTPPRAPLVLFHRQDRITPLIGSFVKAAKSIKRS
jgi:DNA-binding transcriptional LysR family regulator